MTVVTIVRVLMAKLLTFCATLTNCIRPKLVAAGGITAICMACAGASISIDFADKGKSLSHYIGCVSKLLADKQHEQACEMSRDLIAAFDRYEKTRPADKPAKIDGISGAPARAFLELVNANALLIAGKTSEGQWLATYEKQLNAVPNDAQAVIQALLRCPKSIFRPEMASSLLVANIPPKARRHLQVVDFERRFPSSTPVDVIWAQFYEDLVLLKQDEQAKLDLLNLYISNLNGRKEQAGIERALDGIIRLNPNSILGVRAAQLRLACAKNEAQMDELIVAMLADKPDTLVRSAMNDLLVVALARQNKYEQVFEILDQDRALNGASQIQKLETTKMLANKLCDIQPPLIQNLSAQLAGEGTSLAPALPRMKVFAALAEKAFEEQDYQAAIFMCLSAIGDQEMLPLNLQNGTPLADASEIADVTDRQNLRSVAALLVARAKFASGNTHELKDRLRALCDAGVLASIRAYALFYTAQAAAANGDSQAALALARQAQDLLPDSPVIRTFIHHQREKELATPPASKVVRKS